MRRIENFFVLPLILLIASYIHASGFNQSDSTVTDIDGNVYPIVQIGNQIWMAENLRTTHYSDGTPIEDGTGLGDISTDDTTSRFFYYDDDTTNIEEYGLLYNWYAVTRGTNGSSSNPSGVQGISPKGWHIPSHAEWTELERFLGMSESDTNTFIDRGTNQGNLLKSGGSSGLDLLFGGIRAEGDGMENGGIFFILKNESAI